MSGELTELLRSAERSGWSIARTRGGHLKLKHPDTAGLVFIAATPSDARAIRNSRADLKRALRRSHRSDEERSPLRDRRRSERVGGGQA